MQKTFNTIGSKDAHACGLAAVPVAMRCVPVITPDGKQQRGNHGWDDIKHAPAGAVFEQTVTDDTLPSGPHKKTCRCEAPFALANREDAYRIA